MYKKYNVACIIPARGGSKGLPGKNIKKISGIPLIAYSIMQARKSRFIDRVIVSSDDPRICRIAKAYKAEVPFLRPKYLAGDRAGTMDVLRHATRWLEKEDGFRCDILVLLHVTSPLRTVPDIDKCIEMLVERRGDNIFSVSEAHRNPYFNMVEIDSSGKVSLVKKGDFITRQSAPKVFDMNASIYAWKRDVLKRKKTLFLKKTLIYVMPKEKSVDVDDAFDFEVLKIVMKRLKGRKDVP